MEFKILGTSFRIYNIDYYICFVDEIFLHYKLIAIAKITVRYDLNDTNERKYSILTEFCVE